MSRAPSGGTSVLTLASPVIHLGPQAHQLREQHMCGRGGGGLSAHNAGLVVRSIGSGGSQPEPRHGCLCHLHDAFEGVATTHCRAFTRPPGLSFTTGRPCSIPMLSLLASLHHDILNHDTTTHPRTFSSLSRGTALHAPTGLTPPIKLPRCALRVANHFRCAATHLSDATAHPSHHSAVPLTLRANQHKP